MLKDRGDKIELVSILWKCTSFSICFVGEYPKAIFEAVVGPKLQTLIPFGYQMEIWNLNLVFSFLVYKTHILQKM